MTESYRIFVGIDWGADAHQVWVTDAAGTAVGEQTVDHTGTAIAARCGFGTAETMRRNFVRRMGISPDQYRKAYA